MNRAWTTVTGLIFSLTFVFGQECNTLEDPIKNDEGAGPWNVSRVERNKAGRAGKLVPVVTGSKAHPLPNAFYAGDSYVVQYSTREGRKPDVLYFWQGSKASIWEVGASAILTVQLDNSVGGVAKQARAKMNEEPAHFLNMFGGTFVTLLGGVERDLVEQDEDGNMLFRVREQCNRVGAGKPLVRTNQVQEKESSLTDDDVFILKTPKKLFIWVGQSSSGREQTTAAEVVKSLYPKSTAEVSRGPQASKEFLDNLDP